MANYTKLTDFASKDSLPTGSPAKIVKGTEIDDEFQSIENAIATKADINSPALTGTPTAPTAGTGTNSTQVATTAFVQTALGTVDLSTKADLAGNASQAFSASTLNATTVDLGVWTVTESAGVLYFAANGSNKMKLDSSGNLTVIGNITAYGTV